MLQLDENFTSIVLAVLSLLSLIYTKKLDSDNKGSAKKLEAKAAALQKEKELRESIWKVKEEIERIKSGILVSVLHSNTAILKYATEESEKASLESEAVELERKYIEASEELRKLRERYNMLLEVAGGSLETQGEK